MRALLAAALLLALTASVEARSIMIPKEAGLPPLELKSQKVSATVDNGVAITKVDQIFTNHTSRQLEATYVFPVPKGGSVTDFALWINGARTKAEMLERGKARAIYEEIVRSRKDPGLLEYLGEDLFQARVFPIPANGDQRVEITYQQQLPVESGLAEYRYPLQALAGSPPQELTIDVTVNSQVPLRSVYSPSHSVAVKREGDHSARATFEQTRYSAEADFALFIAVSEKDFGLNLLCSRKPGEEGYFVLMLAPKQAVDPGAVVNRDLCFVLDTSGSMQGDKMTQAQKALKFCVQALNEGDRFNVIKFSTDVEKYSGKLVAASKDEKANACKWIDRLEALGGTAIDDALTEALGQLKGSDRPSVAVFLTDGKPTVGETDAQAIVKHITGVNDSRTRLFVLGVGDDLNAKLLDQLAGDNRGVPVYIGPKEDLEVKVSDFYGKISHPVLTDLAIDCGTVKTSYLYPSKLPDLYKGSQLAVYGRYAEGGDTTVKLTGTINGKKVEFAYPAKFAKEELERDFIPRLWATRRVGYLLEQIRRNGEQAELKDEVITLAKRYGIVTPYTAYLVVEDESQLAMQPVRRRGGPEPMDEGVSFESRTDLPTGGAAGAPAAAPAPPAPFGSKFERAYRNVADSVSYSKMKESVSRFIDTDSGAEGVAASKAVQELKQADASSKPANVVALEKGIEGRTFTFKDGVWIDSAYQPGMEELRIKYGSPAYFDLVLSHTELKKALAVGERVIVVVGKKALVIGLEGKEKLEPAEIEAFFKN
jgi:Ca-activated chloride channel family protein